MSAPVSGYRSRLVPTREEDVPADVAARFRRVCAAAPTVDAGYACMQQVTFVREAAEERLGLAVHMRSGHRSRDEQTAVMRAFAASFPGERLAFLEDVAVPSWRGLGVQVY